MEGSGIRYSGGFRSQFCCVVAGYRVGREVGLVLGFGLLASNIPILCFELTSLPSFRAIDCNSSEIMLAMFSIYSA